MYNGNQRDSGSSFSNNFSGNRRRPSGSRPGGSFGGGRFGRSRFPNTGGRGAGGFRQRTFDPTMLLRNARPLSDAPAIPVVEYVPTHKFSDFEISEKLKANIIKRGYVHPTPIQDQAIPELLKGKDLVGIARTGTGKTAGFLIPLLDKVLRDQRETVLILAPTRELAVQIEEELAQFAYGLNIFSVLCIGGVAMGPQIKKLYRRHQFVIGTPGRLKDLERQKKLNFANFRSIVLDEVDRMLDMGFIDDVEYIVSRLPEARHSLFFSATVTPKVQEVMTRFLKNPVTIKISSNEPTANVEQAVVNLNGRSKIEVLHDMLNQPDIEKVLIFGRTKHGIEKLSRELIERGFKATSIHGNKSQSQRQRALNDFKSNRVQILLATDVASRGLDIDDISHVINYELPESYEDYIHRIGRTGRANKKGKAFTFVG